MDELFNSIFTLKKRTEVTSFFARQGFKIIYTDFDKAIFEYEDTQVEVAFNSLSHVQAVYIDGNKKEACTG